jgi:arylsulfatase A-like enzyme
MTDSATPPRQPSRPNVLLICTDQQRYDTIRRLGPRPIHTPNLDRLVDGGVAFEHAYTASPVCAPSRASMMTGQFPSAHGLWANGVSLPEQALFTRILADDGYRTGLIGKLHLSAAWQGRGEDTRDHGFEYYRWAHAPGHPAPDNDYHRWLREEHPELFERAVSGVDTGGEPREASGFELLPSEAPYSRWVSTRALEFLAGQDAEQRPFFLWANFYDPHHPFVVPQEYLDRYSADDVALGIDALDEPPLPEQLLSMRSYANAAGARAFADYSRDDLVQVVRAYYQ